MFKYIDALRINKDSKNNGISIEEQVRKEFKWVHNEEELNKIVNEIKRLLEEFGKEKNEIEVFLSKNNAQEIDDEEFAIDMIKKSADPILILNNASDRLMDNNNVAMAAVTKNGDFLKMFSERLKNDSEIQITALKNGGHIRLSECSNAVRDNDEAALASLSWWVEQEYCHLSDRLKNSSDFNYKLVQNNGKAYRYIPEKFRIDEKIALLALSKMVAYDFLRIAPSEICNNKQVMLRVIKKRKHPSEVASYLSKDLKGDPDIIIALCESDDYGFNYKYIEYATQELKNNADFVFEIFKKRNFEEIAQTVRWEIDFDNDNEDYEALNKMIEKKLAEKGLNPNILHVDEEDLSYFVKTISTFGVNSETIRKVLTRIKETYKIEEETIKEEIDSFMNNDYTNYESIDDIIKSSNGEVNEYQIEVTKMFIKAMGIIKRVPHGSYREQGGYDTPSYNKIVKSVYALVGEYISLGESRFLLYEYGNRSAEYEEFRNKLSELTGMNVDCFTSDLEKRIRERQYFSTTNYTPEVMKMMTQKPVVFIGKEKSYFQEDMSNQDSYILEVNKFTRS